MNDDVEELGTFYDVTGPARELRRFERAIGCIATCCEEITETRFRFYINPGTAAAFNINVLNTSARNADLQAIEMEPSDAPTADWRPKKAEAANATRNDPS